MKHYKDLESIINQIRHADESEILEFDFEPCFALMLDIALKLTKVSVDNLYLMQNMNAVYLLEHSPTTAEMVARIESQAIEKACAEAMPRWIGAPDDIPADFTAFCEGIAAVKEYSLPSPPEAIKDKEQV